MNYISKVIFILTLLSFGFINAVHAQKELDAIKQLQTEIINPSELPIPNPCDLLTLEEVKTLFGKDLKDLGIKPLQSLEPSPNKSCFFKWMDDYTQFPGMFLQITSNPAKEENPLYITDHILTKINKGEVVTNFNDIIKYTEIKEDNYRFIYSFDTRMAYWQIGNNYMMQLAFNDATLNQEKMLNILHSVVPKVNQKIIEFFIVHTK